MLRFIKNKEHARSQIRGYFPIFSAVILSLLFSICVVHYAKRPLYFATNPLSVISSVCAYG